MLFNSFVFPADTTGAVITTSSPRKSSSEVCKDTVQHDIVLAFDNDVKAVFHYEG